MNEPLSLRKTKALARMQHSQDALRSAVKTGATAGDGHAGQGIAWILLTMLAPRMLKPIMGFLEGESISDTVDGLLQSVQQQFKKTLGPVIEQHPFASVLVAAAAGALLVKYRRAIADFLIKHLVP